MPVFAGPCSIGLGRLHTIILGMHRRFPLYEHNLVTTSLSTMTSYVCDFVFFVPLCGSVIRNDPIGLALATTVPGVCIFKFRVEF